MNPSAWTHPSWTPLLLATWIGAAALLVLAAARTRRRARTLLGREPAGTHEHRRGDLLILLALLAVAIGLVGPRCSERTVRSRVTGVDLVFLLDVSRSMKVADVPPSRLHRARRAAAGILQKLHPGDRAALAAFAGRGILMTPLTRDKQALRELLPALDAELMNDGSSHLQRGLRAALEAFDPDSVRPRVLLILSDGEDPEFENEPTLPDSRVGGVRVLAAVFGTEAGGTIPDQAGPLRDSFGTKVISQRQLEGLRQLTSSTGGVLQVADAWGDLDLDESLAQIRRDAGASPGEWIERRVRVSQAAPLAALALAFLALEALVLRGTRLRGWHRSAAPAALAFLGIALLGASDGGKFSPWIPRAAELASPNPRVLIEEGLRYARAGEGPRATQAFLAAAAFATDSQLAALAHYDRGVVALEAGDFETARDAFFDALALDPDDDRSRFNLEWTVVALDAVAPPKSQGSGDGEASDDPSDAEAPSEPDTDPSAANPPTPQEAPQQRESEGPGLEETEVPSPVREVSEEEAARWLEGLEDDPGRALIEAGDGPVGSKSGRSDSPAW